MVGICIDVDWSFRGGQQAPNFIREWGARLSSLDLRNSKQRIWTESLDEGDYDYRCVAAHLKETKFDGYPVVELAYEKDTRITRPLGEDSRLSRLFAENIASSAESVGIRSPQVPEGMDVSMIPDSAISELHFGGA